MGGENGSPAIKAIDKSVVHRICSGQVILDLPSAVKELVENSLDAGASSIEINLKEHGEEYFKVIDNGCGISPENFQAIALKHHTSKLAGFSDLHSLTTFGFRGEALSSLCALGNLVVETRTKNETVGTHLTFDHFGSITTEKKTARQVGTTVTVEKLFCTLPVRNKEFKRNIRREYGKLISLLNAYAIIAKGVRLLCTNTTGKNMKSMVLKTQGSNLLKDNIITVFGLNTFQCLEPLSFCISEGCKVEGFVSRPGYGSGRNLGDRQFFYVNGRPIDMPKASKLVNELYKCSNAKQYPIAIMNIILPAASCDVNVTPDKRKFFFSDEDRLMISLRGALEKIYAPRQCSYSVNEVKEPEEEADAYKLDPSHEDADLIAAPKSFSPEDGGKLEALHDQELNANNLLGKALVMDSEDMHIEKSSVPAIEKHPKDFILTACKINRSGDLSEYKYEQSRISHKPDVKTGERTSTAISSLKKNYSSHPNLAHSSLMSFVAVNKRKHESSSSVLSESPLLRNITSSDPGRKINSEMHSTFSRSPLAKVLKDDSPRTTASKLVEHEGPSNCSSKLELPSSFGGELCNRKSTKAQDLQLSVTGATPEAMSLSNVTLQASDENELATISGVSMSKTPISESCQVTSDSPKPLSVLKTCSVLQFRMADLRSKRHQRLSRFCKNSMDDQRNIGRCYAAATVDNSQPESDEGKAHSLVAATVELERLFRKEDFAKMQVIGQFNLGFIIGKLDQDLFIVDQHAADEKRNFEVLSQTTILNQQPLLQPLRLELSPEEEVIASMHMETIRKNGFALMEDIDASPGHRFLLKAIPFSGNVTFGVEDVKELISTLSDTQGECSIISSYRMDTSDSLCPSRVRAMFASRACRTSVMIGDPLTKNEMRKILRNLAELKSPWNCPHGRPTMRHLVDLTAIRNPRLEMG